MITTVRGEFDGAARLGLELEVFAGGLDTGFEQVVLLALAVRLGADNDLVFGIHSGNAGIALNDPVTGLHLGAVIVGDIALDSAAADALALVVVIKKSLDLFGSLGQFAALLFLPFDDGFIQAVLVGLAVLTEHAPHGLFHLELLFLEIGLGAAPLLTGVAGQLTAIDGEHLFADQSFRVTDHQHLKKQLFNLPMSGGNKVGDGGEVGLPVGGYGDKQDVLSAQLLDLATAGDAFGIGQQHDLQQNRRIIGRAATIVIMVAMVENRQIQTLFDEVGEIAFKAAGEYLLIE